MVVGVWDLTSLEHFVSSLGHLGSFDHDECDRILQLRGIEIPNAYLLRKSVGARNEIYLGLSALAIWGTVMVYSCWLSWQPEERHTRLGRNRYIPPAVLLIGVMLLWAQLDGMVQYVDNSPPAAARAVRWQRPGPGAVVTVARVVRPGPAKLGARVRVCGGVRRVPRERYLCG